MRLLLLQAKPGTGYVLNSMKGTKGCDGKRAPRKCGEKASKRGLSSEQVCICAGVQRASPSRDEINKSRRGSFYHLNNVNSLHSRFKEMYKHYRGVASKYIDRYVNMIALNFRSPETLADMFIAEASHIAGRGFHYDKEALKLDHLVSFEL